MGLPIPNSNYPGAIDDYTALMAAEVQPDLTNKSLHMRRGLAGVSAIQFTLGVNPQGNQADVASRLAAIEAEAALSGTVTVQTGVSTDGSFTPTAQLPYRGTVVVEVDFFFVQQGDLVNGGPGRTFTAKRVYLAVGLGNGTYYAGNNATIASLSNIGGAALLSATVDSDGLLSMPITWTNSGDVDCKAIVRVKSFDVPA